jgi:hypothetical protein
MAKRVRPLARLAAHVEHLENAQAREIVRSQAEARIREMLPRPDQTQASPKTMLPALLIINSKSGPNRDSLMRVRELVDVLAAHGIATQVRVKLRKSQARREARAAVNAGYPRIIPPGTYHSQHRVRPRKPKPRTVSRTYRDHLGRARARCRSSQARR